MHMSTPCNRLLLGAQLRSRLARREPRPEPHSRHRAPRGTLVRRSSSPAHRDRRSRPEGSTRSSSASALHRQCSLPWRREDRLGLEPLGHCPSSPRRRMPAGGEHSGVVLAPCTFRRACRHCRGSSESRDRAVARAAAPRGGGCWSRRPPRAEDSASAQPVPRDETVAHVFTQAHRTDHDAGRLVGREILEGVHGEVDLAVSSALARARG